MEQKIDVLIIEDDFWIAGIHKDLVEQIPSFHVQHIAKSSEEAQNFLSHSEQLPHIILLDIYIPDTEGLTLFYSLRNHFPSIDIIVITAANDLRTIVETRRAGAFDFIIKPVDQHRFRQSLYSYATFQDQINRSASFNQEEVNKLFRMTSLASSQEKKPSQLPKGIDPLTLHEIIGFLEDDTYETMTATDISESLGMSRSTVRRYMEYLVSTNQAEAMLHYGSVGRPLRQYIYRKQYEQNAEKNL